MDIFNLIVAFSIGWICGEFWVAYKLRRAIKKVAEDNGLTLEDIEKMFAATVPNVRDLSIELFTESQKNSILLYNKSTNKFIAQADTLEKLAENVKQFNNINLAKVYHNDTHIYFVDGKVKNSTDES